MNQPRASLARGAFLALPLLAILGLYQFAPSQTKEALPADLALVPTDALGFARVRVAELWHGEAGKALLAHLAKNYPDDLKDAEQALGLPVGDVELVTFILLSPTGPSPGVQVITTTKPYDRERVTRTVVPGATKHEHRGKSYLVSEREERKAIHFVDDRTYVLGAPEDVVLLLSSSARGDANGPLRPARELAAEKHHVVYALAPPAEYVRMMKDQKDNLPPDFEPIRPLFPLLDMQSAALALNFGNEAQAHLKLTFPDEATAKKGHEAAKHGLKLAQQFAGPALAQLKAPESANIVPVLKQGEAALKNAVTDLQGTTVSVTTRVAVDLKSTTIALVDSVQQVRDASNKMSSRNNLHQIGIAIHDYEDDHKRFPPQAITDNRDKPLLSWRVAILPYLEQDKLYKDFHLDEPWDSPHNKKLLAKMPSTYKHPAAKTKEPGLTHYQAFAAKGTAFEPGTRIGFHSFLDGSANSLMVIEAAEPVPWTKPEDLPYDAKKPLPKLGGVFKNGTFNALFGDGHVRTIGRKCDEQTLRYIITIRDGNPVDLTRLNPDE